MVRLAFGVGRVVVGGETKVVVVGEVVGLTFEG
jgi:hypothetical protein